MTWRFKTDSCLTNQIERSIFTLYWPSKSDRSRRWLIAGLSVAEKLVKSRKFFPPNWTYFCILQKKCGWLAGTGVFAFLKYHHQFFWRVFFFPTPKCNATKYSIDSSTQHTSCGKFDLPQDNHPIDTFLPLGVHLHCGMDIATTLYCPDRTIRVSPV